MFSTCVWLRWCFNAIQSAETNVLIKVLLLSGSRQFVLSKPKQKPDLLNILNLVSDLIYGGEL